MLCLFVKADSFKNFEGVSLVENAAHLGLPVPKKLKEVLEQLHDRAEKEDNDDEN